MSNFGKLCGPGSRLNLNQGWGILVKNHGLAWRLQLGDGRPQTAKAKVPAMRAPEEGCNFDSCSGHFVWNGQCPCKTPSLCFFRTLLHTILHTIPHPMLRVERGRKNSDLPDQP